VEKNRLTDAVPIKTQLLRTGVNLIALAALLLIPWELSAQQAGIIALAGLLVLTLTLTSAGFWVIERVLSLLPNHRAISGPGTGVLVIVGLARRAGLSSLGLLFFTVWALIYMGVWALAPGACPDCAFSSPEPTRPVADFFYLAVNLAVANPPPDLYPVSNLARAASSIEVVSGLALVTMFAGAFFGLSRNKS
jgi:hypothetical protein